MSPHTDQKFGSYRDVKSLHFDAVVNGKRARQAIPDESMSGAFEHR